MPIKKTIEETKKDFYNIHGNTYNYDKFVNYENNHQIIDIFCNRHKEYFSQRISSHKRGIGCPKCGVEKCSNANKKSTEDFIKQSIKIHGDLYDYTSTKYINNKEKVSVYCKAHKETFNQYPKDHINGSGCPKCGIERMAIKNSKSQNDFIKDSIKVHGEQYEYPNIQYINSTTQIDIFCKKHGNFTQLPYNHLIGHGCPKCANNQTSKAEKEIVSFLKDYMELEESNRSILKNLELDILIPSLQVAVEYNGLYWHSNRYKEDNYHLTKTEKCLEQGVKLVHIFEDEWRDKKEIVKSRLLNIIGKTPKKLFARNCKIKKVSSLDSSKFLNENHIQGKLNSKIRLGLYYNDELVSLMTFGNFRKALGSKGTDKQFELLRFCNKLNTTVVGGASKLLKYFENNFEYEEIISYADRRWSDGELYSKLGFKFVQKTKPNYFYTRGITRENRFKYRKSELINQGYDKNKTEKQIMEELGYSRIYDSGTLKFSKTKQKTNE